MQCWIQSTGANAIPVSSQLLSYLYAEEKLVLEESKKKIGELVTEVVEEK